MTTGSKRSWSFKMLEIKKVKKIKIISNGNNVPNRKFPSIHCWYLILFSAAAQKNRKKQEQTETVIVEDYEMRTTSEETNVRTKMDVRKFNNVKQLPEDQIQKLEAYFSNSDLG